MQVAEAGVVESPIMTRPYRPGVEARRAILLELRRRELAGEPAPSIYALARAVGLTYSPTRRHLSLLAADGLIAWTPTRGSHSAGATLLPAGRHAADLSAGA